MKMNIAAAALCATATISVSAARAAEEVYTFDDIAYWVGSGTNNCAVVVDFNDDDADDSSFVWGYRWNGDAPSFKDILEEIAADDPRFTTFIASSGWVNGLAYDIDDDGGTFATGKTYTKSDEDDLFPQSWYEYDMSEFEDEDIDDPTGYMIGADWAVAYATGEDFDELEWKLSDLGTAGLFPTSGQWLLVSFAEYEMDMKDWSYIENDYEPFYTPIQAMRTFRLGDITYWIGSGTNVAGIAISWGEGMTRAWGYRWNGEAPVMMEVLKEIAAIDKRLVPYIPKESWGYSMNSFGYDVADVGGVSYDWSNYTASDDDAWIAPYETDYVDPDDWSTWIYHYFASLTEPDEFYRTGTSAYTYSELLIDQIKPINGAWNIFAYNEDDYLETLDASIEPATPSQSIVRALPVVDGATYSSLDAAFDAARGGGSVMLPEQSSVNQNTKTVTVGAVADGTLQTYEVPTHFDMVASVGSISLKLNATAAPTLVASDVLLESPLTVSDTTVTVVPGNVIDGLYYGLAVSTNLTAGFSAPTEWVRAEKGRVVLEKARDTTVSGEFYKVRVSDIDESAK